MPIEYFLNLHKIVLVKPSLRMKAAKLFSFGTVTKFINCMIKDVETLEELALEIDSPIK